MSPDAGSDTNAGSSSETLRQFLIAIADAMTDSGDSVDVITATVRGIGLAYGEQNPLVLVLPTFSLVQTHGVLQARQTTDTDGDLRFDQIAAVYALVRRAKRAEVDPADGLAELTAIRAMRPRFGWVIRTLGHAVLTVALALILVPTWPGAVVAFLLGLLIGLAKLVRLPTLKLVFPIVAAFGCAIAAFELNQALDLGDPLLLLIAPLATFLPGGMLATATIELAVGQIVAGSSRLVAGLVQLGLLAFGILAAGAVLGEHLVSYSPERPSAHLPWWVSPLAVLLFALGVYLHFSAPRGSSGWMLLAISIAYGGQILGSALFGPTLSGFVGAVMMTPIVLAVADLDRGAPSQLIFLPAFWILAPGAAGLIGFTQTFGAGGGDATIVSALIGIMSIAMGVLIGAAAYRTVVAVGTRARTT